MIAQLILSIMGLIIAYIVLVLAGAGCVAFTLYEHRRLKQKDIDTELYNQNLQTTKAWLEQETQQLENKRREQVNFNNKILQENEDLVEKQKIINFEINELTNQKEKIKDELTNVSIEKARALVQVAELQAQEAQTTARIKSLNETIESTTENQREAVNRAFVAYCDALDSSYKNKEQEYDSLIELLQTTFNLKHDEAIAAFNSAIATYQKNIEAEKQELEKIRATRVAAQQANLREEELKNKRAHYSISIDTKYEHDIKILNSIKSQLIDCRPLLMAMWSAYYLKPSNDLAARVLGTSVVTGIYKITNPDLGLCYIGQARDIKERWRDHLKAGLGIDTPSNNKLYIAMAKYGIEAFTFELLETCPAAQLNEKEAYYIQEYDSYNFGYNSNTGVKKQ